MGKFNRSTFFPNSRSLSLDIADPVNFPLQVKVAVANANFVIRFFVKLA